MFLRGLCAGRFLGWASWKAVCQAKKLSRKWPTVRDVHETFPQCHISTLMFTSLLVVVVDKMGVQQRKEDILPFSTLNVYPGNPLCFSSLPSRHPREHRASRSQCRTISSWLWRWRVWCSTARPRDSSGRSNQFALMLLQFFRVRRDLTTKYVALLLFSFFIYLTKNKTKTGSLVYCDSNLAA